MDGRASYGGHLKIMKLSKTYNNVKNVGFKKIGFHLLAPQQYQNIYTTNIFNFSGHCSSSLLSFHLARPPFPSKSIRKLKFLWSHLEVTLRTLWILI